MGSTHDSSDGQHRRLILTVVIAFLILTAIQAHKPLNLDNADLPVWAKAVADTGKPIAYRGETRPVDAFIYHTPLYLYALGSWFNIVGCGASQIRMFGAICTLLLGWISFQAVVELFGPDYAKRVSGFFWPVFLLNPYTLQLSAIADIDSTIYGPLLCGFLLTIIRLSWRKGKQVDAPIRVWDLLLPTALLTLSFWAKLTTVWLIAVIPVLLLQPRYGWKRSIQLTAVVAGTALIAFGLTFWTWCHWMNVSFTAVLRWLASYPVPSSQSGLFHHFERAYGTLLNMLPFTIKWTGLPAWGATALVATVCLYRARGRNNPGRLLAFTLIAALVGSLAYISLRATFGSGPYKYYYVFWGFISLSIALLAGGADRVLAPAIDDKPEALSTFRDSRGLKIAGSGIFIAMFVTGGWLLGDRALGARIVTYLPLTILPALVALAVGFFAWRMKRYAIVSASAVLVAMYQIGLGAGISVFQVRQPYSTTYNYGQSGLSETAEYIRAVAKPEDMVMCMKDLGPMTSRRYFESYGFIYSGDAGAEQAIAILSEKVRFAVFTEQIGEDQLMMNAPLMQWVTSKCRLVRSIGNYRIYETPVGVPQ